jgi:hypothetical protein
VSIRRALACVLMVTFAAGSALRLECLLSCGQNVASPEPSTCHASATTGEALGQGTGVCLDDDGPVAIALARSDAPVPAAAPPASVVPALALHFDRQFSSHTSLSALASPPNAPPLPLRI